MKILDRYDYEYYPELGIWYKFHKTPTHWGNARLLCKGEKANLAIPKNKNESDIMKLIFAKYPKDTLVGATCKCCMFVGFHDHFMQNEYITESGEKFHFI